MEFVAANFWKIAKDQHAETPTRIQCALLSCDLLSIAIRLFQPTANKGSALPQTTAFIRERTRGLEMYLALQLVQKSFSTWSISNANEVLKVLTEYRTLVAVPGFNEFAKQSPGMDVIITQAKVFYLCAIEICIITLFVKKYSFVIYFAVGCTYSEARSQGCSWSG